jgi:hypothetical protein
LRQRSRRGVDDELLDTSADSHVLADGNVRQFVPSAEMLRAPIVLRLEIPRPLLSAALSDSQVEHEVTVASAESAQRAVSAAADARATVGRVEVETEAIDSREEAESAASAVSASLDRSVRTAAHRSRTPARIVASDEPHDLPTERIVQMLTDGHSATVRAEMAVAREPSTEVESSVDKAKVDLRASVVGGQGSTASGLELALEETHGVSSEETTAQIVSSAASRTSIRTLITCTDHAARTLLTARSLRVAHVATIASVVETAEVDSKEARVRAASVVDHGSKT